MRTAVTVLALLFFVLHCKSTQKTVAEVGIAPIELEPVSRKHYRILGDVTGYATKKRIFFLTFGDDTHGTIHGHREEPGYRVLKVTMCWVSLGLICHNYPLDAKDAAVYAALASVKDADALISVRHEKQETDWYFYQKVHASVSAKAIRYLTDEEIQSLKLTTPNVKLRSDEDEEEYDE